MENDKLIQKLIKRNFKGKTVLAIAHRLSTIADSDLILSLDFGELIDFDTPANLLANPLSTFSIMMESCEEVEKRKICKLARATKV